MQKFKYYKRVVEGETIELHLHENKDGMTIAKIYPESGNEDYKYEEFIEINEIDEWMDEGLKTRIFEGKPAPNHIST